MNLYLGDLKFGAEEKVVLGMEFSGPVIGME
jgi:hypothetical protein